MNILPRTRSWLRAVLRRSRLESEIGDEMRCHVEQYAESLIRNGASPDDAHRLARAELGALAALKEACRDALGLRLLDEMTGDFRYAIRQLRGAPTFAVAVVVSLALGIGATTAIYTLLETLLWRELPVRDPSSLLVVGRREGPNTLTGFTYPQFNAMRTSTDQVELAAYSAADFPVRMTPSQKGTPEPSIDAQLVSGNYFSLLGITPYVGRLFSPADDQVPNSHPVVVLAYSYWERRFGADSAAIGQTLLMVNRPFTIIGVTPRGFTGVDVGGSPDVFLPVMMQAAVMPVVGDLLTSPTLYRTWLQVLARVAPGADPRSVSAELEPAFRDNVPVSFRGRVGTEGGIVMDSATTGISPLRQEFSSPLFILMTVVVLVLVIGCANAANLLLARSASRRLEFSLRLALGAGRARLTRQMLVEGLLLAAVAGMCGLVVAQYATRGLIAYASTGRSPIILDLSPNGRVMAFAALVSMATGILFALAPVLQMSSLRVGMAGKVSDGPTGRLKLQKGLVISQTAVSLILLVAAGAFLGTLRNIYSQGRGIDGEHVLLVRVEPHGSNQRGAPGVSMRLEQTYRDLMARVAALPGVRAVSMGNVSPTKPDSLAGAPNNDPRTGRSLRIPMQTVFSRYFETLGIPFVAGRDFTMAEEEADQPVCIVNEAFVRALYPNENPLGKPCFNAGRAPNRSPIVGVVADSRYVNLREPPTPVVYTPFLGSPTGRGGMILYVRSSGPVTTIAAQVRQEVWNADATVPQYAVRTLAAELDAILIRERLVATVSTFFGTLGVILTALGLHGLLTYVVAQRSKEFAIRMALGANPLRLVWLVTGNALAFVLTGAAATVPVVWGLGRFVPSLSPGLLFELSLSDPTVLATATFTLILVGTSASVVPAWRAVKVQPMAVLRD